jgi:hypothetical protein
LLEAHLGGAATHPGLPAGRKDARRSPGSAARRLALEAQKRRLLRAEQMTWFWLNHFNVFPGGFRSGR